jgi:hypothetical protein
LEAIFGASAPTCNPDRDNTITFSCRRFNHKLTRRRRFRSAARAVELAPQLMTELAADRSTQMINLEFWWHGGKIGQPLTPLVGMRRPERVLKRPAVARLARSETCHNRSRPAALQNEIDAEYASPIRARLVDRRLSGADHERSPNHELLIPAWQYPVNEEASGPCGPPAHHMTFASRRQSLA